MLLALAMVYFIVSFTWLLSKRRWKQAGVTALIGLILIGFLVMMSIWP
jgi:multisubunit Na+/H+ antiporter MnhB subunit